MGLLVEEHWINATKGHGIGDSGIYESYFTSPGQAYRECQKMYGRCISKVYIDRPGTKGQTHQEIKAVGWAFQQRIKYEDSPDTFIRETWVTLHEKMPEKHITHHYQEI